jgi:hypothetical protein
VKTALVSLTALLWQPGCELLVDNGPPMLANASSMGEASPFEASAEGEAGGNATSEAQREAESASVADTASEADRQAESASVATSDACSLDCASQSAMCKVQCTSAQASCAGVRASHGGQQKCAKEWGMCQSACVSDCSACVDQGGCIGSGGCGTVALD